MSKLLVISTWVQFSEQERKISSDFGCVSMAGILSGGLKYWQVTTLKANIEGVISPAKTIFFTFMSKPTACLNVVLSLFHYVACLAIN